MHGSVKMFHSYYLIFCEGTVCYSKSRKLENQGRGGKNQLTWIMFEKTDGWGKVICLYRRRESK